MICPSDRWFKPLTSPELSKYAPTSGRASTKGRIKNPTSTFSSPWVPLTEFVLAGKLLKGKLNGDVALFQKQIPSWTWQEEILHFTRVTSVVHLGTFCMKWILCTFFFYWGSIVKWTKIFKQMKDIYIIKMCVCCVINSGTLLKWTDALDFIQLYLYKYM